MNQHLRSQVNSGGIPPLISTLEYKRKGELEDQMLIMQSRLRLLEEGKESLETKPQELKSGLNKTNETKRKSE